MKNYKHHNLNWHFRIIFCLIGACLRRNFRRAGFMAILFAEVIAAQKGTTICKTYLYPPKSQSADAAQGIQCAVSRLCHVFQMRDNGVFSHSALSTANFPIVTKGSYYMEHQQRPPGPISSLSARKLFLSCKPLGPSQPTAHPEHSMAFLSPPRSPSTSARSVLGWLQTWPWLKPELQSC